MFVRLPIAISALAVTFAAGVVGSQLIREAHAQTAPFASTMYVPADGLTLRTLEGHVVARLSYDSHGGMFELYDEHERPTTRVRADSFTPAPPPPTPPATETPHSSTRKPDLGF
jgi:hypothetical protein